MNRPSLEFKCPKLKMDETRLKHFCQYNIILIAQSKKKAGGNISTCESFDLGSFNVFLLEGSLQLLEVAN
jgi:hypothetical protein